MKPCTRICIDLDDQGQPLGTSLERHHGEDVTRITVVACGPFDTAQEALDAVVAAWELSLDLTLF